MNRILIAVMMLALLLTGCASQEWQGFKRGFMEGVNTPSTLVHSYESDSKSCRTFEKGGRFHTYCIER